MKQKTFLLHKLTGEALKLFVQKKPEFIIVGASGWLGMATLQLLSDHLKISEKVTCFGSIKKTLKLLDGTTLVQHPLEELSDYPKGKADYLLNYAFLTKENERTFKQQEYIKLNRQISIKVFNEAKRIRVANLSTISSGSVYSKERSIVSDLSKNPYGYLKKEEEVLFSGLKDLGMKVVIPRVFNLSGPYSNKKEFYMFSSLLAQALKSNEMVITSKKRIFRSFISTSDLLSTIFGSMKLLNEGESVIYDTCGDSVVEIGELALQVKDLINKKAKIIRPDIDESLSPDKYIGSRSEYESLINKLEIKESSLQDQIVNTSEYMKVAYNLK